MHTPPEQLTTRPATPADTGLVLEFIRRLADYEKRPGDATATEEDLRRQLFENRRAQVLLAELGGEAVGYALYYPIFTSFAAQSFLYLEDLFIDPARRGEGLGRELLRRVAAEARRLGYAGLQWSCLEWNTPSIEFYERLGARRKGGAVHFTFDGAAFRGFAKDMDKK